MCFISILRLLQLIHAQTDPDFTYAAAALSHLTAVEINGAIVCACVMTLKPLLSRIWPRFLGGSASFRSSRSRSGGYRNRRGSETLVGHHHHHMGPGGPPTIGSLPRKLKVSPLDELERDVWIETRGGGGTGRRRVWVDGGYVEIEDGEGGREGWGADVELAENVRKDRAVLAPSPELESGVVRVDTEVRVQVFKAEIK